MTDGDSLALLRKAVAERKIRGLDGYTFCFTGNMSMRRDEMQAMVRALGGRISSTVTRRTTHLVAEHPDGYSTKITDARSLRIKIISEQEFSNMLNVRVN